MPYRRTHARSLLLACVYIISLQSSHPLGSQLRPVPASTSAVTAHAVNFRFFYIASTHANEIMCGYDKVDARYIHLSMHAACCRAIASALISWKAIKGSTTLSKQPVALCYIVATVKSFPGHQTGLWQIPQQPTTIERHLTRVMILDSLFYAICSPCNFVDSWF